MRREHPSIPRWGLLFTALLFATVCFCTLAVLKASDQVPIPGGLHGLGAQFQAPGSPAADQGGGSGQRPEPAALLQAETDLSGRARAPDRPGATAPQPAPSHPLYLHHCAFLC